MSCYHPLVALKIDQTQSFRPKYKVIGSLEGFGSFDHIKDVYSYADPILVPCGQCKGCRVDLSRAWADRMVLEFDHTKKAVFVTLTYDDEHLPLSDLGYPTVLKSDLQTFMKDLRGNKYYDGKEIRFFGSAEYGSLRKRSHYHVILFGLSLDDFRFDRDDPDDDGHIRDFQQPSFFVGRTDHHLYYDGQNKLHQPYYRCPHLDNVVWKKGRCCIAEFSWESAAYTARYVRKKLNGELSDVYFEKHINPPFALMSRRPGIGSYFIEDHPEKDLFEERLLSFKGKLRPLPNFIFDKLADIDPIRYNEIKEQRKRLAEDRMLLELQNTDLSFEENLAIKEHNFDKAFSVLSDARNNAEILY